MAARARLVLQPHPSGCLVEVGGQRLVGVKALTLSTDVDSLPRLELDPRLGGVDVEAEVVTMLPEGTRQTLIALGWTPPAGQDGAPSDG